MKKVEYDLIPVNKKPPRKYSKRSKYDPIIDDFLDADEELVKVDVEGKEANYLRTQIKKRIDSRGLDDQIDASVVNGNCYLERTIVPPTIR
ncbi:MAG: hypothetical protein ACLFVP_07575 [Candidatus Bathyarchaeia archaeon]